MTTALCASLLTGAATPAFAANHLDERVRPTFVSTDLVAEPDPGAAPAQQPGLLGSLTGILAPVTGLLTGLLGAPQGRMTPQDAQDAQQNVDDIRTALPETATEGQTKALTELQSAVDDLVKEAASGDTGAVAPRLSKALSGLLTSLTTQ